MADHVAQRAVVLGGSMGGLLAARVLSESFTEVLVVDRDELAGVQGPRRGVPHGRHAHGLVAAGQQILEDYFPGLVDEHAEFGVVSGDFGAGCRWSFNGRPFAPSVTGLISLPATRPVLEFHVRRRVLAIPNVRFLERHDILGLATTPDHSRVTGARVVRQGGDLTEQVLEADLVVDCTGRGSRMGVWLEELGYRRPAEDKVKIGLAYTTRHFQLRPESDPLGDLLAIIPVATPENPRGALLFKLAGGGGRVGLSLTGVLGDHAPTDPAGFLEFARSLPVPEIYDAIEDAEPLDDAVTFKYPASVRKRYEKLTRFPSNLLVMGDAVCSFNPVYGQGMSVAALESRTLRRLLAKGTIPDPRRFFRDIAKDIDAPWELSGTSDLGYAGVEGRRSLKVKFVNAYVGKLQEAAQFDPELATAFIRAAGLIDKPQALMKPATMIRVLRGMLRRPPSVVTEPTALPTVATGPDEQRTDRAA